MFTITINGCLRQAFINHLSRFASQSIHLTINEESISVEGLPCQDAAKALAYSSFLVWENYHVQNTDGICP